MKAIHFNCVGGASGDMILGALIGLGVDVEELNNELKTLMPEEEYSIETETVELNHMKGTRCSVNIPIPSHTHRHLSHIVDIINGSELAAAVKERSIQVFTRLAEAEATVHNTTKEHVHFHEVGAVDSIVDIVGACLALAKLGVEKVSIGPFPIGQGTFECAHGVMPLPAPATAELLKGFNITQTTEPFELVTPTGAALLTSFQNIEQFQATLINSSNSFGHRTLKQRPNLLKATLFELDDVEKDDDSCMVLECNIDDSTPEIIGHSINCLLDAGALDAYVTPVYMKKNRPGFLLSVLCHIEKTDCIEQVIFKETSTFGIRKYQVDRTVLERKFESVETPYGKVKIKIGSRAGHVYTRSPEIDDCIVVARSKQVPLKDVYQAVQIQNK